VYYGANVRSSILAGGQRTLDDLGTPLSEVTFCVVDLETTGGDPTNDAITEIGAVKVRGGEPLGSFRTFVNPGTRIPTTITVLTGITQSMVEQAPPAAAVLPTFLEFLGGAVVVGHNIRFDIAFLDAALVRSGRERLGRRAVDTCALARRLVRDEVPNCRLGTLAKQFRLPHRPSHRALDDALATADLLHLLLERAAAYGVTGLDDLHALPTMAGHPQASKLRLTSTLPRAPGVYLFRDRAGSVLYIGKATDLRSRVRSYFSSDDRRKIGPMLREASAIEHHPCGSALEAGVLEARLLHALRPRYNRQGTRWDRAAYVRLDTSEAWPRLVVARSAKVPARAAARGSGVVLGPLPSAGSARLVVEAVEEVAPLRRCPERLGRALFAVRESPCTSAQLGVAHCPCAGEVDEGAYLTVVDHVRRGLTGEPRLLLDPLADRIAALASQQRFEEAAAVRDRAAALSDAITRTRRFDALRATGHLRLELPGGHQAELEHGILRSSTAPGALPGTAGPIGRGLVDEPPAVGPPGTPLPPEAAHELLATAGFLDRYAGRVRITDLSGRWASPLPRLPSFRPAGNRPGGPTV
jgi:DNA polymerase III subunit epsilon